jgi:uncharacterized small protein (DUF1192 family)
MARMMDGISVTITPPDLGPDFGPDLAFLIDLAGLSVNFPAMDMDEIFAKRPGDPLALLVKQDLDPLSVTELEERVAVLEAEIVRVTAKLEGAVNHKASADALFKR